LQGKRQTLSIDVKAKQDLLPTKRLVAEITKRRLNGEDVHDLAFLFHDGLAQMIVSEVIRIAQNNHLQKVALSGGCFQNTLLLALVETRLKEAGFCVYIHHLLPPNDGGIACGQAYYGLACLKERRNDSCV
ncbi:MAG TPA: carbamoyltransferase HypF, partial [Erysipelotrichaceae bacterium]|nr:carbamoyltransferase HypF [Erysipelotrichaceae bacterium]